MDVEEKHNTSPPRRGKVYSNKLKNKHYQYTIRTVPISNRKIVETGKIYTPNTRSLNFWAWYRHFNKYQLMQM